MGTNSKFALLPMAVKTEYVFFRMAAPVTSGLITGESVVPQHKKAKHLPCSLRQPQKQVVAAQEEVVAQKNKPQAVTCHQAPQKR